VLFRQVLHEDLGCASYAVDVPLEHFFRTPEATLRAKTLAPSFRVSRR
jgi:hypothetical protein